MASTDLNRASGTPATSATNGEPLEGLNLVNAGWVADLYERYRTDPASIDPEWRALFDAGAHGFQPWRTPPPLRPPSTRLDRGAPMRRVRLRHPGATPSRGHPPVSPELRQPLGPDPRLARDAVAVSRRPRELMGRSRRARELPPLGWAMWRAAREERV